MTTTRKDIRIQTAQTYYAISAQDLGERDAPFEQAIGQSPFDYLEIHATATVDRLPGKLRVAMHVNASDVMLLREGTRCHARLETELVQYGPDGVKAVPQRAPVNLDMSEEDDPKAMAGGIEIMGEVGPDETVRRVRAVVLDLNSNLAGTVTIPARPNP